MEINVVDYMPYVRQIAGKIKKTVPKEIDFDDLVAYGMIGLVESIERYDETKNTSFMTFAYYRIRGAILDGLRTMGWLSRAEYSRVKEETSTGGLPILLISEEECQEYKYLPSQDVSIDDLTSHYEECVAIRNVIQKLNDREKQIIDMYYYKDMNLEEVGNNIGMSKSWISRLHERTINKCKRMLEA